MSPAGAAEPVPPGQIGLSARIRAKRFPAVGDAPAKLVVRDLELEVPAGSFTGLFGPSGCGKTTTLNLLAGIDPDFEGEITRPEPARIAYVFQEPRLLPWRTVEDNLRLVLDQPDEAAIDRWLMAMELAGVRKVYPTRLSLGMARRVALARAFVVRPSLLLMDEPFVSLDEPTAERLRHLLLRTHRAAPATTLFVTHNLHEAVLLCDRIAVLTPTPTRIERLVEVPLGPSERLDGAAVDRVRRSLEAGLRRI